MKTFYQTSFATIHLDCEQFIMHLEWSGPVPSDSYRKTMLQALELIKKHFIIFGIQDLTHLRQLSPMDCDWMVHEFLPLLFTTHLKKVAILQPASVLDSFSLQDMVYASYSSLTFDIQYYEDVTSAMEWLNSSNRLTPFVPVPFSVNRSAISLT